MRQTRYVIKTSDGYVHKSERRPGKDRIANGLSPYAKRYVRQEMADDFAAYVGGEVIPITIDLVFDAAEFV